MAKTLIWSDLHLGHQNIIDYCGRPFKTAEEMDAVLIDNWRTCIKPEDTIFNLGDVAMKDMKDKTKLTTLIRSLPGYKILLLGNHDKPNVQHWRDIGFDEVYPYPIIYNKFFIMSHDTTYINIAMPYANIHGHLHEKTMTGGRYINVCVEHTNYKPIDLDELMKKGMEQA